MTDSDLLSSVEKYWDEKILPTLMEYIEIPAKSPDFDANWEQTGHLERVLQLASQWVEKQKIPGLKQEILRHPGRTPLLLLDLPGDYDYEVLMYGHLDKQPEMTGWSEGLSPWKAVRRGEKLYGRGGADDGYAVFASVCAIDQLLKSKMPRPHIKAAIELCEESGSQDLPFYFEKFSSKFGSPDLIICLDSGTGNYEQFWTTTSLRGLVGGELRVEVLDEGVHSGDGSGVVASSFRIARMLLNRLENVETGEIFPEVFKVKVPPQRMEQVEKTAAVLSSSFYEKFPFAGETQPVSPQAKELMLNRTWRAALSVVAAEGLPDLKNGGNVLRPYTTLKLFMRLPPTVNSEKAAAEMKRILESNPPYNATVKFQNIDAADGWDAPPMQKELSDVIDTASQKFYKKPALAFGEGGTIPFMGMLGQKFPMAQFVITGVLGPESNAHGPNEFIHVDYAKKLTACIAHVLMNAKTVADHV